MALTIAWSTPGCWPAPGLLEPTETSIACPGWPTGIDAIPGVIEEQCPAVTTMVGVTSVPVHANAESIVMYAT